VKQIPQDLCGSHENMHTSQILIYRRSSREHTRPYPQNTHAACLRTPSPCPGRGRAREACTGEGTHTFASASAARIASNTPSILVITSSFRN
jgi:hypothetical protein